MPIVGRCLGETYICTTTHSRLALGASPERSRAGAVVLTIACMLLVLALPPVVEPHGPTVDLR